MKYFKRAGIYQNSTKSNSFDPEIFKAYSYNWWLYVADFGGVKVFNNYSYSNTTNKHQVAMLNLLSELGYDIDSFWFLSCPKGLQDLDSGIKYYQVKIRDLKDAINKPRSHRSKNKERRRNIKLYKTKIKQLMRLKRMSSGSLDPTPPRDDSSDKFTMPFEDQTEVSSKVDKSDWVSYGHLKVVV